MPSNKVIIAYVPVIHKGYLNFFQKFSDITECFVVSQEHIDSLEYLKKDIRALDPSQQVALIKSLNIFTSVKVLEKTDLKLINQASTEVIMPNEDICSSLASSELKNATITYYPVFLRWNRDNVNTTHDRTVAVTDSEFDKHAIAQALITARSSPDIWRRVGAALVKDKTIVKIAYNNAVPNQHSSTMEGDPRNIFKRGVAIEMSTFLHAEAALIAEAAKNGESLEGASLYVTTFPCPACAKLIAHSGIKKCYFKDGYAVLDGQSVLDQFKVKAIRVLTDETDVFGPESVPYYK